MKKLLVGVDGSMRSLEAVRWAKGLADLLGVGLTAVTACGAGIPVSFGVDQALDADDETAVNDALRKTIVELGLSGVETMALHGTPSGVLHEAASAPDVVGLVIGTRGLGTLPGLLLGSVSRKILFDCAHPLFLLPDRPPDALSRFDHVLTAVDGSAISGSVTEWSARLCARLGASATVLRCVDPGSELPTGHLDAYLQDVRALVDERWCAPLRQHNVQFEVVAARGDARHNIIDVATARDAGVIVVAGRGEGQFQGMGGTTSYLVRHSPIPLAVVPCDPDWDSREF